MHSQKHTLRCCWLF